MGSIMGSQNIMGSDYGSNISVVCWIRTGKLLAVSVFASSGFL